MMRWQLCIACSKAQFQFRVHSKFYCTLDLQNQHSTGAQLVLLLTGICWQPWLHLLNRIHKHMLKSNICVQELQEDFAFSLHRNEDLTAKLESSAQASPPSGGEDGSMQQSEEPQSTFQVSAEAPRFHHGNAATMQSLSASHPDHQAAENQNLGPQETGLQRPLAPAELHTPDAQHDIPVLKPVRARSLLFKMELTCASCARFHWDLHPSHMLSTR